MPAGQANENATNSSGQRINGDQRLICGKRRLRPRKGQQREKKRTENENKFKAEILFLMVFFPETALFQEGDELMISEDLPVDRHVGLALRASSVPFPIFVSIFPM